MSSGSYSSSFNSSDISDEPGPGPAPPPGVLPGGVAIADATPTSDLPTTSVAAHGDSGAVSAAANTAASPPPANGGSARGTHDDHSSPLASARGQTSHPSSARRLSASGGGPAPAASAAGQRASAAPLTGNHQQSAVVELDAVRMATAFEEDNKRLHVENKELREEIKALREKAKGKVENDPAPSPEHLEQIASLKADIEKMRAVHEEETQDMARKVAWYVDNQEFNRAQEELVQQQQVQIRELRLAKMELESLVERSGVPRRDKDKQIVALQRKVLDLEEGLRAKNPNSIAELIRATRPPVEEKATFRAQAARVKELEEKLEQEGQNTERTLNRLRVESDALKLQYQKKLDRLEDEMKLRLQTATTRKTRELEKQVGDQRRYYGEKMKELEQQNAALRRGMGSAAASAALSSINTPRSARGTPRVPMAARGRTHEIETQTAKIDFLKSYEIAATAVAAAEHSAQLNLNRGAAAAVAAADAFVGGTIGGTDTAAPGFDREQTAMPFGLTKVPPPDSLLRPPQSFCFARGQAGGGVGGASANASHTHLPAAMTPSVNVAELAAKSNDELLNDVVRMSEQAAALIGHNRQLSGALESSRRQIQVLEADKHRLATHVSGLQQTMHEQEQALVATAHGGAAAARPPSSISPLAGGSAAGIAGVPQQYPSTSAAAVAAHQAQAALRRAHEEQAMLQRLLAESQDALRQAHVDWEERTHTIRTDAAKRLDSERSEMQKRITALEHDVTQAKMTAAAEAAKATRAMPVVCTSCGGTDPNGGGSVDTAHAHAFLKQVASRLATLEHQQQVRERDQQHVLEEVQRMAEFELKVERQKRELAVEEKNQQIKAFQVQMDGLLRELSSMQHLSADVAKAISPTKA